MTENVPFAPCDPTRLRLTVLYENHRGAEGLRAAWGFSCLVEGLERPILFDTGGDAEIFQANLSSLDIDLTAVRDVVLSHAHWDHVTGVERFRGLPAGFRVFVPRPFPVDLTRKIQDTGGVVHEVLKPREITEGAFTTGAMGMWIKEQALLIPTTAGTVVLTGCAHPGPAAIAKRSMKFLGQEVLLLAGGFHLMEAGRAKVDKQVARLRELGVRHVAPGHCSGDLARDVFRERYGDRYHDCSVGRRLDLRRLVTG